MGIARDQLKVDNLLSLSLFSYPTSFKKTEPGEVRDRQGKHGGLNVCVRDPPGYY